jgi:RNA polymerase sigma-70 factor (ECF subfamily)
MQTASDHESLFTAWWREHRSIFFKIARSFTSSAADEDDLVQEMLMQLWRSLSAFNAQCQPSTWIYRVCLNTALTRKRGEKRRLFRVTPTDSVVDNTPCAQPLPPAQHERTEKLDALYAAIRRLPASERSLVLLLLDGLNYRDIGEITGLTENHVGVALTRARKKLTELLKEVRHEL